VLREIDTRRLEERGHEFSTYLEGKLTLLVIENYELPDGYTPQTVDLLIQIPSDYPDANLDMWWVFPAVVFTQTNAEPVNTQVRQAFAGYTPDSARQWQRFSRHPNWQPGVDDLRTFLVSLRSTMEHEAPKVAA
jgi:hypothetical protein